MKKFLTTTAIVLVGTAAFAQSAGFEARIKAELEGQGYTVVEVENEGAEVSVEATRDGMEFEFTYDSATEALLSTEEEPIDADDEADDDDADEADEDEDEDEKDDD